MTTDVTLVAPTIDAAAEARLAARVAATFADAERVFSVHFASPPRATAGVRGPPCAKRLEIKLGAPNVVVC
jgi:hypothetical protein